MRLALLTNNQFPPREGIARHVLEVGRQLQARGHAVTVIARGAAFAAWEDTVVAGVRVRSFPHYPVQPFHHTLARSQLAGWLREGADGAELLHVHLPLLPPLPTDLPVVATFHSPLLHDTASIAEPGWRPALIKANARLFSRRYEQAYLDRAMALVAVSNAVRNELATSYSLHGRQPTVVPNGVDTNYFRPDPANDGRSGVLYVGRLGYRKGLFRLLDAFAQLPPRAGLELTLVGEGPLEQALRRHAAVLGLGGRIRFAGFLDRADVRHELRRAACFVNPADYETGPLTLLEAMACGTPVVSTPTGLAAEMGARPPLLLSAPEPAALATAIDAILVSPEIAADRAREARILVERGYCWDRVVDRLEGVYGLRQRRVA